jgi:hypothetical protein
MPPTVWSPACVNRGERRRAEQSYDERYGQQALAGEIHHASRAIDLGGAEDCSKRCGIV